MNFTQLRAFHAVASAGGFTRGARRLGISQPAVTVQVRALEQRYGVALFRRLGQRIELTEFGRELWQRTRRAFAELDDLEELLASAGELRVGRLEIGADGPFSVMDLVASFIARYRASTSRSGSATPAGCWPICARRAPISRSST